MSILSTRKEQVANICWQSAIKALGTKVAYQTKPVKEAGQSAFAEGSASQGRSYLLLVVSSGAMGMCMGHAIVLHIFYADQSAGLMTSEFAPCTRQDSRWLLLWLPGLCRIG